MMKILVFSDSHRNIKPMREVLDTVGERVQRIIHLGDNMEDAAAIAALYPRYRHYAVSGNCDFYNDDCAEGEERILNIFGCKMFLTHGHLYGVKRDYSRITYAAEEAGAQLCLFGHTHVPVTFNWAGICFMNPGSISLPRSTGFASYGVIELDENGKTPAALCTVVGKIGNMYRPVDVSMQ